MRTHRDIVTSYGASSLARALQAHGFRIATNTPQRWAERNSVPAQYWRAIEAIGAASADELIAAAPMRKAAPQGAAA